MKNLFGLLLIFSFLVLQLQGTDGFCTSSSCELNIFNPEETYCCDDECCTYSEYYALNSVNSILKIGVGAIIGISVGSLVCLGLSIAGCVYCCCRSNSTSTGTVITTQPAAVTMQQYPAAQHYPTVHPYPPAQQYPTVPQQAPFAPQYPGVQADFNQVSPDPYATKSPPGPPPPY